MAASASLEPSARERTFGALVHLGGIVGPLWIPLAVWIAVRGSSPFIAAHAWQEFRDAIVWKAGLLVVGLVSLSFTITRLVHHYQTEWREFSWQEVAGRAIVSVAVFGVLWVWNLVQAVAQARTAQRGVWPKRSLRARERVSP